MINSKISKVSTLLVNGKLVDEKGFIVERNNEDLHFEIFNNNQSIHGEIDEEDLMKILEHINTKNNTSIFNKLTEDFPIKSETKKKKKKKHKPTKKIKKK